VVRKCQGEDSCGEIVALLIRHTVHDSQSNVVPVREW
jgi:hypothetical protein